MSMSGKQMMEREAQLLADLIAERDRQKQAIIASTEQCAALVRERDELQKQVWLYEQNGVTCQTYRHKIEQSCSECNVQMNYTNPPQPEQEPVAIVEASWNDDEGFVLVKRLVKSLPKGSYLYTTSPQRTWVGLTDEDKASFWKADQMTHEEWQQLFAEVEAKLKEKNK